MAGELITLESAQKPGGAADEAGPRNDRGPSRFSSLRARFAQAVDPRIVSVAAAGLALGTVLGVATAPRDGSREMATTLKAEIAGLREDVARLSGAAGGSTDALARIRDQLDAAAGTATRTEASATDRGDRLEKLLSFRFAEAKADRERSEGSSARRSARSRTGSGTRDRLPQDRHRPPCRSRPRPAPSRPRPRRRIEFRIGPCARSRTGSP